ncbi:MAG TPA: DUF4255 domain-containing protein [Thermoanaerobaculia bacterium]|jgi:hypothetical protein
MSNHLAIATVTAALSDLLANAVAADDGAGVTTIRPDASLGTKGPGVNIFLYQVTPNASWQNADLPTRRAGGEVVQRPVAALDLHYLLTCYGDDTKLQPQRVLGKVVRTLHAHPVLTRDMIRKTVGENDNFSFLKTSNLADAVELVKLTPIPLSLEELSKLWSIYFQTQYNLSVAYQATVVLIESEEPAQEALPVRERNVYVVPFRQSVIEEVRAKNGADPRIGPASTLQIRGARLRGEVTQVSIDGATVTPPDAGVSDREIVVALPPGLHAGVHGLQVVQPRLIGTPPVPHRGIESNLVPFVLHPAIRKKGDGTPDIALAGTDLTVKVDPAVGKNQRAVVLLNGARSYSFESAPRNKKDDPDESDTLTFPLSGVAKGDYLVRVQIDGADSALELDPNAAEPIYSGPKVTIP